MCFNRKNICVDRSAAPGFIQKGAYLGACEQPRKVSNNSMLNANSTQQSVSIAAYPNPLADHVTISFKEFQSVPAIFRIYDMNGRLISTLYNKETEKNIIHTLDFSAGKLSSGAYILRLQTSEGVAQKKIVLRREVN